MSSWRIKKDKKNDPWVSAAHIIIIPCGEKWFKTLFREGEADSCYDLVDISVANHAYYGKQMQPWEEFQCKLKKC